MTKLALVILVVLLKIGLNCNVHSQQSVDFCVEPPVCPIGTLRPGEQKCSLLQQCCTSMMLDNILSADILRTDVSVTVLCPFLGENYVWSLNRVITGVPQDIQIDNSRYTVSDMRSLVIQNVTGDHEGIYRCRASGSDDVNARCLVVLGRGRFKSCPGNSYVQQPSDEAGAEGSCLLTERKEVQIDGTTLLNVSLEFEKGGVCRNQIVRTLTLSRVGVSGLPPPPSLFTCSNIPGTEFIGFCCEDERMVNTGNKFTVMYDSECEKDCKYRIALRLNDFNASDVGLYEAVVTMDEGRVGARRVIKKFFNLTIAPDVPIPTPTEPPPTSTEMTSDGVTGPSSGEEQVAGIVVGVLFAVVAVMTIVVTSVVVVVVVYRYKTREMLKAASPADTQRLQQGEQFNNTYFNATPHVPELAGAESQVGCRISVIETLPMEMTTDKEEPERKV